MKLQNLTSSSSQIRRTKTGDMKKAVEKKKNGISGTGSFTKSAKISKPLTYKKTAGSAAELKIKELRQKSEEAFASLKRIVEELLLKQGSSSRMSGSVIIDENARSEAAALIAEGGPLGAEAVSSRIVDFAKALAGEDKSKIPLLREAIEKGFSQVKVMLGGLPEVSQRTYALIMEDLRAWEQE